MEKKVESLKQLLRANFPHAVIEVDGPGQEDGNWWIDVRAARKEITLEYRPGKGFGIFHEDASYGGGPAEVYRTPELATRRVAQLMTAAKGKHRLTLKDLRELYEVPQVKLAAKVGVKQSAISRFEQRSEVKLGTLAAAVKALGGELEVRAHFSDADVPISVKD